MDFGYLLQILNRRKWLVAAAMLATGVTVFYLIGKKPEQYKSTVVVATGIVNYKGFNSTGDDAFVQQFQIENAFSNLIDFAQSRSSFKLLTLYLLKHDLNAEKSNNAEWPFRQPNLKLYGPEVRAESAELLQILNNMRLDSITDPAFDSETDYLIDRVSRVYGYDHDAIGRSLSIKRKGSTDYLSFEVVTENPRLAQYMADGYVRLFMDYYQNLSVREKRKNAQFYKDLYISKKAVVDTIKNRRYAYLFRKGLPALGKQSEELVSQISDLELQKQKAEAKRLSSAEAMGKIQQYIDNRSQIDAGETRNRVSDKYGVAELSDRVRTLTEKSVSAGGKDSGVESDLTAARRNLDNAIKRNAGSISKANKRDEETRTKEDLYKDKIQADVDRIEAENSIGILDNEIRSRTGKLSTYVANDEVATGLAEEQENAEEEYKKINEELIKANLSLANAENPMHILENAQLPEWPEPNRRTLLSVFAAIVVGTFSIIGLFLLAFMDRSFQSPELFARYTKGLPLLGYTPFVRLKDLDFQQIFYSNGEMPQFTGFRENLRKMRNTIQQSEGHIFLFTSTKPQQGKTLTAYALANALAANHKRVVMLDTNFKTPLPEELVAPMGNSAPIAKLLRQHDLEEIFFPGSMAGVGQGLVMVIGHQGAHLSPSELIPEANLRSFLSDLRDHFDYIFLEAAALNHYSDAQELIPFVDKVIAVFSASDVPGSRDQASLEILRQLGDKFTGSILTGVDEKSIV